MEVSNIESAESLLIGDELIEKIVSLTGLPELVMKQELGQILENSGQNSADLTLNELREALLVYLESMQADFLGESVDLKE